MPLNSAPHGRVGRIGDVSYALALRGVLSRPSLDSNTWPRPDKMGSSCLASTIDALVHRLVGMCLDRASYFALKGMRRTFQACIYPCQLYGASSDPPGLVRSLVLSLDRDEKGGGLHPNSGSPPQLRPPGRRSPVFLKIADFPLPARRGSGGFDIYRPLSASSAGKNAMPLSRKKSCARCRRAKARCDQGFPSCSRCYDKGQRCDYEGDGPRVIPYMWMPAAMDMAPAEILPLEQDQVCDVTACPPVLDVAAQPAWFDVDAPDFLECLKMGSFGPSLTLPSLQEASPSNAPLFETPTGSVQDSISTTAAVINAEPKQVQAVTPNSRGTLRRRIRLEHNILSNILVGQLTSYPKMMIEGDVLPPFICPPCFTQEHLSPECGEQGHHRCLPEDLAVCAGLVRMYYDRTASSSAFVWKSIYDECYKLHDNVGVAVVGRRRGLSNRKR